MHAAGETGNGTAPNTYMLNSIIVHGNDEVNDPSQSSKQKLNMQS